MKVHTYSVFVLLLVCARVFALGTDAADVIYDPATGNVILDASDTASGVIISFVFATEQDNLRPENFRPGEGLGSMGPGPFIDVGTNTDATTFQIGQTDPLFQGVGPLVDLGDILPPGFGSIEEVADYLTFGEYASALGDGGPLEVCNLADCILLPQRESDADFDFDGDIDTADRNILVSNWTGALPSGSGGKTLMQGDSDGDEDVDSADHTSVIQQWTGAILDADLIYDGATGNVTLDASDTRNGMIIGFEIGTDQDNIRCENFTAPFEDSDCSPSATRGSQDPGLPLINLGNIFPVGIPNRGELAEYLTLAEYASEPDVVRELDLIVIPAPIERAVLFYDPATGNVTLDASGTSSGMIISFEIGTDQDNIRCENFTEPFVDSECSPSAIGGSQDPGLPLIDLGDIFPAGIPNTTELAEYLTMAEYASAPGVGGELSLFVIFIPEPDTSVLMSFGMLLLVLGRQRR